MSNSALVGASKRVPEIVSVIVVLIAGLALVGWATGSVTLTSLRPTLPPMRPNAAAGLILGSASLWLLTGHWLDKVTRTLGVVCALLVALLGFITLIEHLLALNTGIEGWLFQSKLRAVNVPGRLPVSTALSFLMSGIALLTLHFETRRGSRPA
ncbi:MAG TPA: histidine kinase, partial [Blastocatellia bacterium]|nr:histidine kinase [Blastocatellia bacterium]